MRDATPIKGRGTGRNHQSRFDSRTVDPTAGETPEEGGRHPQSCYTAERARSLITRNRSPDIRFSQSVNPYRGCEHGCPYCFARPTHSYLSLSPGLEFETQIIYKVNAPELLARELSRPGYRCQPIALGVNTDAYQPVERQLRITRRLLEVLLERRHPVMLITKASLIERDLDLLAELATLNLVSVAVSVTSLDDDLGRRLEPRAAGGRRRLRIIQRLSGAGVPVCVMVAPVIPVLTDHELESILRSAAEHGATTASYTTLRLPHEVREIFEEWLQTHYPDRARHVMSRVRELHAGRDYDSTFGTRMRGQGDYARMLAQRFRLACRRHGLATRLPELDTSRFRPGGARDQMDLFNDTASSARIGP
jgi:DNA repair photolyase